MRGPPLQTLSVKSSGRKDMAAAIIAAIAAKTAEEQEEVSCAACWRVVHSAARRACGCGRSKTADKQEEMCMYMC